MRICLQGGCWESQRARDTLIKPRVREHIITLALLDSLHLVVGRTWEDIVTTIKYAGCLFLYFVYFCVKERCSPYKMFFEAVQVLVAK